MVKRVISKLINVQSVHVRSFLYVTLVVICAEIIHVDAIHHPVEERFSEYSYTEQAQSVLLVIASAISFYVYLTTSTYRSVSILIFTISSVSFFREQDVYFEEYLGRTTWLFPVIMVLILSGYLLFTNRRGIISQLTDYATTFSGGIFFAAFSTVYIFSRLFGRSTFWKAVMDEQYQRTAKAAAEECVELYGYLLLLFAVIELLMLSAVRTLRLRIGGNAN